MACQRRNDVARIEAPVAHGQSDAGDAGRPPAFRSLDNEAPRAIVGEQPGGIRQTPARVDGDTRRVRARDQAHCQPRIVGQYGARSHNDSIDQGPETVQVIDRFRAVDIVRAAGGRGDSSIQRLAKLSDDIGGIRSAACHRRIESPECRHLDKTVGGLQGRIATCHGEKPGPDQFVRLVHESTVQYITENCRHPELSSGLAGCKVPVASLAG